MLPFRFPNPFDQDMYYIPNHHDQYQLGVGFVLDFRLICYMMYKNVEKHSYGAYC